MFSTHRLWRVRLVVLGLLVPAALAPIAQAQPAGKAKYVFLMIGDGMGPAQRAAAEIYLAGPQEPNKPVRLVPLAMNTLPYVGIARTQSRLSFVTDSGAAATAMATGNKVPNSAISLEPNTDRRYTTLAEIAKAQGWKVGIVSSAPIDDATPAAFYAHQDVRGNRYEIAMELAGSGFDYFAGGYAAGTREAYVKGRTNPVDLARQNGYQLVTNRRELEALKPGAGKVWHYWTKADANGVVYSTLFFEMERPADQPSLPELTRKGIELLDNPAGFFMMVEGGEIDGACHVHDLAAAVTETVAFDQAVAVALEFYKKRPDETLLIVTNDHETGGLGLGAAGDLHKLHPGVSAQKGTYWTFCQEVAAFREKKMTFAEAWPAIQRFYGFEELAPSNLRLLQDAYALSMIDANDRPKDAAATALYGTLEPLAAACHNLMGRLSGVAWASHGHTNMPAPVTAIGAGAERFTGYYENTDLFHKIRAAMAPAAAK